MGGGHHHDHFKALGPIDWAVVDHDNLDAFLDDTFTHAQTLVDSIPIPENIAAAAASRGPGRARSHTDSALGGRGTSVDINRALSGRQPTASVAAAAQLQKEWRDVKPGVYKLAAKDGRGSWFARRSVHEGVTFDKWRLGLEREFAESLKVGSSEPGAGKIRGIGAERRVEMRGVEGKGRMEGESLATARFWSSLQ
jgi:hypothetical protein